ncbi:unnamed protein product, partial [Tetraodon nigroviridis]
DPSPRGPRGAPHPAGGPSADREQERGRDAAAAGGAAGIRGNAALLLAAYRSPLLF